MKKLLVLLVVSVFVLTGCSTNSGLSNSTNIATIDGMEVTTDEVFQVLKEKGILDDILTIVDTKILSEMFPLDGEEYTTARDAQIEEADAYYQSQYGKTLEEMLEANNMTMEDFEGFLKVDTLRNLAVKKVISESITDGELLDVYNALTPEIKASHILITPTLVDEEGNQIPAAVAEAVALDEATKLIERLNNGEDFAELAKEFSADGSAANGGDLGYFTFDRMVPEFATAAYALEVGEYTAEAVKSQFGYHIILKTDEKKLESYEDMKEEIKNGLVETKMSTDSVLVQKTLHDIRMEAGLEFSDTAIEEEYNTFVNSLNQ
jgi:parvulin-like peptidyl-prolyl isomerase